ncbi:MAG: preprotein translocase subunit SecE [Pseudomonadales bacterium]
MKWVVVGLIVAGGVYGYYHFAGSYAVAYRALALVPVAAVAVYIAVLTTQGRAFFTLLREAAVEVRRVVADAPRAVQTTLVVMGFVVLMALVLWGLDAGFAKLVSVVIG